MKQNKTFIAQTKKTLIAASSLFVILTSMTVRGFEVGVINSWLINNAGGGPDYGFKLMVRQEIWRYMDIGARTGYMRSDSLDNEYVPLTVTAAIKYPLFEKRFVPFVGAQFGYHFYPHFYRSSQEITPYVGFDWRFGSRKQWSFYVEGVYQFGHVHWGESAAQSRPIDGPGGSWGCTYRF